MDHIQVGPKKLTYFLYALTSYAVTSSNIDQFSNLFHYLNQTNICNNTVTKDPTTPQMCRYTTLWNVTNVIAHCLKSNNWKQATSVTTYFKKLTTANNVFIVLVISGVNATESLGGTYMAGSESEPITGV